MSQPRHTLPVFKYLFYLPVIWLWPLASGMVWLQLQAPGSVIDNDLLSLLNFFFVVLTLEYAFEVVESSARGVVQPPTFISSLASFDLRLVRLGFLVVVAITAFQVTPPVLRELLLSGVVVIAPAVVALTTFHEPMLQIVSPRRIRDFMQSMGITYFSLRLMLEGFLFLALFIAARELALLQTSIGEIVVSVLLAALVLLMLRVTGILMHVRRNELGISTLFSTEQAAMAETEARRAELIPRLKQINRRTRQSGFDAGWQEMEQLLRRRRYADEALVYELLKDFSDRRLLDRLASGFISRLLETEPGRAWTIFDERWQESPQSFRLHAGGLVLQMAGRAELPVHRAALRVMLAEFGDRFPDHPGRQDVPGLLARLQD